VTRYTCAALDRDIKSKALFFKTINVQQKLRRSEFHLISDDLNLVQAADLLRKQAVAGRTGSKTNPMRLAKAILDLRTRPHQELLGMQ
jgi:hypothetical protein